MHSYVQQLKIYKNGLNSTICKEPQTRNYPNAYQNSRPDKYRYILAIYTNCKIYIYIYEK